MDHDRLFKELLRAFFYEFIALFFADLAAYMVAEPPEFLDKEIFTDVAADEAHQVDLVAKVRFRDQGDACFLIHVENQASAQPNFPRRMFKYFARLHEKYTLPVFPIALFSFDQPKRPEPDRYVVEFPNFCVVNFAFKTIQLNRLNWRDFLRKPNPVASALMTKMDIAPEDRPRVKLECLRMLATLKLDRARAKLISVFMDSYLKLTAAEAAVYNQELEAIEPKEREAVMEWTNEWIESGKIQGRQEGLLEGRQEGRQEGRHDERLELVLRLLRRRLGPAAGDLTDQVAGLSDDRLADLAEALLDFRDITDAHVWLASQER